MRSASPWISAVRYSCCAAAAAGRCRSRPPRTSNVQVLGPLEAAGLGFDQLWLCGMQADRWPAPARPNPFIPQPLQRRLQMPHASAQREWAFATALMDQFTRSTRDSARQLLPAAG